MYKSYVPDPLGSTVALLDDTQTPTDTFTYWPYGEVNTSTGNTPTPFKFVGTKGYYTDDSGKMYVRARVLDPSKGRWLTEDPMGFGGGDSNLYRYVAGRPASATDPSGVQPQGQCRCGCKRSGCPCAGNPPPVNPSPPGLGPPRPFGPHPPYKKPPKGAKWPLEWCASNEPSYDTCVTCVGEVCSSLHSGSDNDAYNKCIQAGDTICTEDFL